ncbi:MAG: class I SAM-dependent methyltransferase [Gordonia sp. (in: high G+C Gram-positive bacteria)]
MPNSAAVADRFAEQNALGYDARITTLVPGYAELHEMTGAVLRARVGERARILVVGAGTGTETLAFARSNPQWQLVGVDPSPDMLAVARRRAAAESLTNVEFVDGFTGDLEPAERFDGAVALLVMHFVAGDGGKRAFLADVAGRLRPGAPLLLCDLMSHDDDDLDAMAEYTAQYGADDEALAAIRQRLLADFHPVDEARLGGLAVEAGLSAPRQYFAAMAFRAYEMRRAASGK